MYPSPPYSLANRLARPISSPRRLASSLSSVASFTSTRRLPCRTSTPFFSPSRLRTWARRSCSRRCGPTATLLSFVSICSTLLSLVSAHAFVGLPSSSLAPSLTFSRLRSPSRRCGQGADRHPTRLVPSPRPLHHPLQDGGGRLHRHHRAVRAHAQNLTCAPPSSPPRGVDRTCPLRQVH